MIIKRNYYLHLMFVGKKQTKITRARRRYIEVSRTRKKKKSFYDTIKTTTMMNGTKFK